MAVYSYGPVAFAGRANGVGRGDFPSGYHFGNGAHVHSFYSHPIQRLDNLRRPPLSYNFPQLANPFRPFVFDRPYVGRLDVGSILSLEATPMRKLTHEEIVVRQATKLGNGPLPFIVILNNIRSLYNVGSIFRTADGAGVAKIYTCGITGHPPNNQISKTALGAEERISWEHRDDIIGLIQELRKKGYQMILLEQMEGSLPYEEFKPDDKVCLVIGNEIEGVSKTVVEYCDQALEIEMAGLKNSLNVSVAFGILAYHVRQYLKKPSNI